MTDTPHSTRQADALIDALAKEGTVDSAGAFTVDGARAQAMLEGFRLANPHRFVLSLLRAAVIGGATRLVAEIDRRRVTITFDGAPFAAPDLEALPEALLVSGGGAAARRLTALAEALFAAERLPATRMTVEADGPEGGLTLRRRPDGAEERVPRPAAAAQTRVIVDRESVPLAESGASWDPAEIALLARCGRFAPLTLEIDGRPISQGLRLPDARFVTPIEAEGCHGVAGLEETDLPAGWAVVQDGVVIAEEPLDASPSGFLAAVVAPAIRLDLGLTQAVRDAAWEAALRAVRESRDAVLDQACRLVSAPGEGRSAEDLLRARDAIRTAYLAGAFAADRRIEDLAVWPLLGRSTAADHVSLRSLRSQAAQRGALAGLSLPAEALSPAARRVLRKRRGVLHLASAAEVDGLAARLGVPAEHLDDLMAAAQSNEAPVRRVLALFGAPGIALVVAIVATLATTVIIHQWLAERQRWPGVPIALIDASYKKDTEGSGKNAHTVFRVSARYTYRFGGKTYREPTTAVEGYRDVRDAEEHVARLRAPGYLVYVNPRNPSEVLHRRTSPAVAAGVGASLCALFLGLLCYWLIRARRLRAREEQAGTLARETHLEEQLSRRTAPAPRGRNRKRGKGRR